MGHGQHLGIGDGPTDLKFGVIAARVEFVIVDGEFGTARFTDHSGIGIDEIHFFTRTRSGSSGAVGSGSVHSVRP